MKRIALLSLALALIAAVLVVPGGTTHAQGGELEYGVTVQGELTAEAFEVTYTFSGTAGDIVVAEMGRLDFDSDIDEPAVQILDANGALLGLSEGFGTTRTVVILPADGVYTVVATRTDGIGGESVGPYLLTLYRAPVLQPGESFSDTTTSAEVDFYAINTAGLVNLNFNITGGDFRPAVTVSAIDSGEITDVFEVYGERLQGGTFTLQVFSGETLVVAVEEALFDFNFEPVTAEYSIGITASDAPPAPPTDTTSTEAEPAATEAPVTGTVSGSAELPATTSQALAGFTIALNHPEGWVTEAEGEDGLYLGSTVDYITAFRDAPPGEPLGVDGNGLNLFVAPASDIPVGSADAVYDLFSDALASAGDVTIGPNMPFVAANFSDAVIGTITGGGEEGRLFVLTDGNVIIVALSLGNDPTLAEAIMATASAQ